MGLHDSELRFVVTDLELEQSDVLESLLVLDLSNCQFALKNLNFLVKQGKFVVSSDKLGSQDVSRSDVVLVGLLQFLILVVGISNDVL